MELHELEPGATGREVDLDETPEPSGHKRPPKGGKKRLCIALISAVAVCAAVIAVVMNWTAILFHLDPTGFVTAGALKVVPVPEPLSLGFLGAVELDDVTLGPVSLGHQALNCAGSVALSADSAGLRVFLPDCTLGTDDFTVSFSLYADADQAAAQVPFLFGAESWYGLRLDRPLAGDSAWGWLFSDEQRAQAEQAAGELSRTLAGVTSLHPGSEEAAAFAEYFDGAQRESLRTGGQYVVRFVRTDSVAAEALGKALGLPDGAFAGASSLEFTLTGQGVLRSVGAVSENLCFDLDLGDDPGGELTPRLEASWRNGAGEENMLTLAFTVEQAGVVSAPAYEDIFAPLS